jgi:hypothetical protein
MAVTPKSKIGWTKKDNKTASVPGNTGRLRPEPDKSLAKVRSRAVSRTHALGHEPPAASGWFALHAVHNESTRRLLTWVRPSRSQRQRAHIGRIAGRPQDVGGLRSLLHSSTGEMGHAFQ